MLSRGFLELELRTHVLFKEQTAMGYVLIEKHSMGWCDAQPGVEAFPVQSLELQLRNISYNKGVPVNTLPSGITNMLSNRIII